MLFIKLCKISEQEIHFVEGETDVCNTKQHNISDEDYRRQYM